jgi:acetyl-CoA carboxylase biotin carboxylase subunit
LEIVGVHTTKGLHQVLAADAEVAAARFDTRWLERWLEGNVARLAEAGSAKAKEVAAT